MKQNDHSEHLLSIKTIYIRICHQTDEPNILEFILFIQVYFHSSGIFVLKAKIALVTNLIFLLFKFKISSNQSII